MATASRVKLPGLRQVREARLMTQVELSEKTGLARSTLIGLELQKAAAQFRTVRKLADVLGVDPTALTGGASQ